jgi:hypothetical protein
MSWIRPVQAVLVWVQFCSVLLGCTADACAEGCYGRLTSAMHRWPRCGSVVLLLPLQQ